MSIYNKPVSTITLGDLEELLVEGASENLQLEFKSVAPGRAETLKKLSSFANTYGGYLIIGAEEDGNGRLLGLSGIQPVASLDQQLAQWCFEWISPPIQPYVSGPIPVPSGLVCYVVHIPESGEGPHFLNGRKGAYVRTGSISSRFQEELATYEEISFLANRRQRTIDQRDLLLKRTDSRFDTYTRLRYGDSPITSGELGACLKVVLVPSFPTRHLVELELLRTAVSEARIQWRSRGYPYPRDVITQNESVIIPNPGVGFSMLEANIWGQNYNAVELEHVGRDLDAPENVIHTYSLVGHLLAFLRYGASFLTRVGYEGNVSIRVILQRVLGRPLWFADRELFLPHQVPRSEFDDEIDFFIASNTRELSQQGDDVLLRIIKVVLFSMNWPYGGQLELASETLLDEAYEYSRFPPRRQAHAV